MAFFTINHFKDSFSGHANFTLSGELDGVVFAPVTIGSNARTRQAGGLLPDGRRSNVYKVGTSKTQKLDVGQALRISY